MSEGSTFGNAAWMEWEEEIRLRRPEALKKWRGELMDDIRFYYFQQDPYVIISTPCPGGWTDSLTTYVEQFLLSADGKIIMECWGNLFCFFTHLIKERLSKYQLADSLLVAISG